MIWANFASKCFMDKCDHDSWNRGSQELPLKFGQNCVSNSWDITYMSKCRQDKCCMEKMWLWQLASVKEGPRNLRNLPWKFGQNLASNSWDITNMDKCCQDKCCLDKCHHDSWHLLKMVPESWLKFGQNWVSNSWDIANIEFLWVDGVG